MSDGRKRLSGAQYKSLAEEKRRKRQEILDKTPNLKKYFLNKPTTSSEQTQELETEPEADVINMHISVISPSRVNVEEMSTDPGLSEYRY